ncbi:alpha/beta hydrolase [Kribbella albertanoniae]|uniref:Alpha/beta hydrolase n=1 Tax=Kribbella albertanoniae TaxID=1266829 RepID=A0A4R4PUK4_9ACTN|nr:alpha/beta hydrolase [Kribbella albertanoniae]TDC26068.1 alpha/beta hydrolase [Kribbella albertanoniae]
MRTRTIIGLLATVTLTGGALVACSSSADTSDGSTTGTAACPQATVNPPGGNPPAGGAAGPTFAKTVAPSDTSTSTVIDGSGPEIQCGRTPLKATNDIVYDSPTSGGRQVPLKLDLQVPLTAGAKPLVVYLTGGQFSNASKAGNLDQRTYVAEQGYAVAGIEYRTVRNGATYKEIVADVKSAIRFLRAHAAEYGIDPAKVAVWGQSAGGYLAAMTGVTNGRAEFEGTGNPGQSSDVQAVVDEFGPADIAKIAADFDAAAQKSNHTPGNALAQVIFGAGTKLSVEDEPAVTKGADPATYVGASDPSFLFLHGSADQLVSPSQTLTLHNALRAEGADTTRYVVQGGNHGDLSLMTGDTNAANQWSSQQVMGNIVSFLAKHLG